MSESLLNMSELRLIYNYLDDTDWGIETALHHFGFEADAESVECDIAEMGLEKCPDCGWWDMVPCEDCAYKEEDES